MRFATPFNGKNIHTVEFNSLPSLTIPDQSLTILEMLDRHVRGIGFDNAKTPEYLGENDPFNGVDFKAMELTDQQDLLQETRAKVRRIERNLDSKAQKRADRRAAQKAANDAAKIAVHAAKKADDKSASQ